MSFIRVIAIVDIIPLGHKILNENDKDILPNNVPLSMTIGN